MSVQKDRMKDDAKYIRGKMCKYDGETGAHFGFIVREGIGREFVIGGRSDFLGMGIAEALATLACNPQLHGEEFIDAVLATAKEMFNDMNGKGEGQVQ